MKLRNKVLSVNLLLILAVMIILGSAMLYTADNYNLYAVYKYLLSQSDFADNALNQYLYERGGGMELLVSDRIYITGNLKRNTGFDVDIIPNYESYIKSYTSIDDESKNPKAIRVAKALEGSKAYYVESGTPRVFYLTFPVYYNKQLLGVVEFKYPLDDVDESRREMVVLFLILFGGAYGLALIFSYLFSAKMINPLEKLQRAANQFARGDFLRRVNVDTGDEIEDLSKAFNHMGDEINIMFGNLVEEQAKQKRFLDSVTHEIRTPLTNILGYADLIGRIDDDESREKCLEVIRTEGQRMLKMMDSLLELSRLKQYEASIVKKVISIKDVINSSVEAMKPRLERYGFKIENELDDIKLNVDPEMIKQVILNLFDNTIKYSNGDTITVKLYKDYKTSMVSIDIEDNGEGIPEEVLSEVATPFVRADKSRSRKMGGAGLGLSLCREIILKHDGTINFFNKVGGGLRVAIRIPDETSIGGE